MRIAVDGYTGARSGAGLVVTATVHVALGAALLTLGIVKIPTYDPAPIITRNVPLPPKPEERIEPKFRAEPVELPIYAPPVIDNFEPLRPPELTAPAKESVRPPMGSDPVAEPLRPPPAEPVIVPARLDPRFAARFQPPYPVSSQRHEEEGVVLVRVLVGPDGRVLAAEVVRSSGHSRLDEAAVAHARRAWRFVPATRDGIGVESWKEIPVRFELKNG